MDRHIPEPWTQAQWEAITASGNSGQAGSGKTAVLVERVIHRLLETENPVDLDRFLVALYERCGGNEAADRPGLASPDEARRPASQKQQSLLNKASISTLHSLFKLDPQILHWN